MNQVKPASPCDVPLIGFGYVRHKRLRPRVHRFVYPTFFLMLPMRTLQRQPLVAGVLAFNRPGVLGFRDSDHGDGRGAAQGGALAWLEEVLHAQGIFDADGEIWLQCYPRVLGYSFKPVSFWYCQRSNGSLRAIVAEVNNTFGERHTYVLDRPQYGQEVTAHKVFHVSPFCPVEGGYRFEFKRTGEYGLGAVSVRVDYDDMHGPLLLTGVGGRLQPLNASARRYALWRYPLMTLVVTVRIHWHACGCGSSVCLFTASRSRLCSRFLDLLRSVKDHASHSTYIRHCRLTLGPPCFCAHRAAPAARDTPWQFAAGTP